MFDKPKNLVMVALFLATTATVGEVLLRLDTAARADIPSGDPPAVADEGDDAPAPMLFEVTAYTRSDAGMNGKGITTSGARVKEWHTVAADWSVLPKGSVLYIPFFQDRLNQGIFVVEDTGGSIKGQRLDVYMASKEMALWFGRKWLQVYVLGPRTELP